MFHVFLYKAKIVMCYCLSKSKPSLSWNHHGMTFMAIDKVSIVSISVQKGWYKNAKFTVWNLLTLFGLLLALIAHATCKPVAESRESLAMIPTFCKLMTIARHNKTSISPWIRLSELDASITRITWSIWTGWGQWAYKILWAWVVNYAVCLILIWFKIL